MDTNKLVPEKVKPVRKIKEKKVQEAGEKKPRKYSFIDAFSEWKKEKQWQSLCPKKGTDEYQEIFDLYQSKK